MKLCENSIAASILIVLMCFFILFTIPSTKADVAVLQVQWQQFLPGISGISVIQTSDGGYLALGVNASIQESEGDSVFANQEPILVKTDASGNVTWTKTYHIEGGRLELSKVIQTNDGGYTLCGVYEVPNVFLNRENKISLIKIDNQGDVQWYKLLKGYYGSLRDAQGPSSASFIQTDDGGYVLVAEFWYNVHFQGMWLVKTDSLGNLQLNKTITGGSVLLSIVAASDDGYVIFSQVLGRGGGSKFCATKIDSIGNTLWRKTYIQENKVSSYANCGTATSDGGYILGGYSILDENNGWVVKTDEEGNISWNASYCYKDYSSSVQSISQAVDGGFILLGTATTTHNMFDLSSRYFTWVTKTDGLGNVQGEIGIEMGNHLAHPTSIIQANNGGLVFVGTWNELSWATSDQRFWLVKLGLETYAQQEPSITAWIVAAITIIAVVVSLIVYFKKRKQ